MSPENPGFFKNGPWNADAKKAGCGKMIRRPHSMILLTPEPVKETLNKPFKKVIIEIFKEDRKYAWE